MTDMLRILAVVAVAVLCGAGLAAGATTWAVRPGLIGAAGMLLAAYALGRYWRRTQTLTGSPQRALWLNLGSVALLVGYLLASLWRIGPAMTLHTPAGHALGIDTWTMVFAALIAHRIARDPDPRRDERDAAIDMRALRIGNLALIVQVLAVGVLIAFEPMPWLRAASHALIAHLLIAAVMLAALVQYAVQLHAYWRDEYASGRA